MKNVFRLTFAVLVFGLAFSSCKKNTGEKAVTGEASGKAAAAGETMYKVNPAASQVLWTGSKPTGQHTGTIQVAEGMVGLNGQNLVSGNFSLDMNSLSVSDLQPGQGKEKLESHLKGTVDGNRDDFFNVTKFPNASFSITNVGPATAGDQNANATITGDLTIRDVTKSVTFPAYVGAIGNKFTAVTPNFTINRTEWGVNFKSKSIFDNLKDDFISDDISLSIKLEASK
ncbi:MAG: YceI family protein [Saprospiraceae bacterium]|nr:YceI family protein [Saprospiraceae bacterium]